MNFTGMSLDPLLVCLSAQSVNCFSVLKWDEGRKIFCRV